MHSHFILQANQYHAWFQLLGDPVLLTRLQEVSILKSLNYDRNITQFYGACIRPGQDLMLVTEVRSNCHS